MFNPFAIVASFLPGPREAQTVSLRWQRAVQAEPMIIADIIMLGRVLAKQPAEFRDGVEVPTPIDPSRVLIDAGRRELALELLALCKIDQATLAKMIGEQE
jgi:hypothetical protein